MENLEINIHFDMKKFEEDIQPHLDEINKIIDEFGDRYITFKHTSLTGK